MSRSRRRPPFFLSDAPIGRVWFSCPLLVWYPGETNGTERLQCRYEWAAGWASTAAYIYAARLPRPPRARSLPAGRRNLPGTLPDPAGRGARLSAPQGRHHVSPVTYACSALDSRPLVCPIREEINCWERDANERNRLTKRWLRYSLLIVTGEHYPTVHGACVIHRCADVN